MRRLAPDGIDVWEVNLSPDQVDRDSLSDDEVARAERFVLPLHAERFMAARSSLRKILARYTQQAASDVLLEIDQHGKPSLAAHQSIYFNLAHSEDQAVIAIAGEAVGIDLELLQRKVDCVAMAERFFCPRECDLILSEANPEQQRLHFLRIWSAKEAVLKLIGTGLRTSLKSFDAGDAVDHESFAVYPERSSKPAYLHALAPNNAVAHVATWNSNAQVNRQQEDG